MGSDVIDDPVLNEESDAPEDVVDDPQSNKRKRGKLPKKIMKAERERLKREQLNVLFDKLAGVLDLNQENNGKACVLNETIKLMKYMVSHIQSLRKENATLLSESQYMTAEKNELKEENSALEVQIRKMQNEVEEKLGQSKPVLNASPPLECWHGETPSHFMEGQLPPLATTDPSSQQPILGPLYVIPINRSNDFSGVIPSSLSNLKRLQCLDLSGNRLSGSIPEYISELKELNVLSLLSNELSGEIPQGVGELPMLEFLLLWNNDLNGSLPSSLGTNGKLVKLDVSSNRLTGVLPEQLCSNNTLEKLILFNNQFTGELPTSLVNCTSLVRVRIQNNLFNGSIPTGFGHLPNLVFMDVSKNNFSGNIPNDLGIAPKLMNLNVSENFFSGELPNGIWGSPSLQIFSASFCGISGNIPDFNGCKSLYQIEMEGNNLKGTIPWNIGHCEKLISLNLRKNMLTGIIPWEISTLPSINIVDLSYNNLSGSIPSNFDNCRTLETFNVSFNLLTGSIVSIPSSGSIFPNLNASSFMGNEGLCGNLIGKPCLSGSPVAGASDMEDKKPKKTAGAIVWIMAAAFGVGLFVLIAGSRCFHANYSRKISEGKEIGPWKLTAFQRLNFTADDVLECLAMSDKIIGMGATGTVYRAEMPSGEIIAIKKLWGKQKETLRRRRGVLAEVEVLGNVRHRNIVRLLGCCCNRESTLLLYEYMPNGSLDDLLHGKVKGENLIADWLTRYKIALGVAQGICYLHHDCDPVIVHRDLKPSNILLDAEMEARVADFGVAKLIQSDESMSVIAGSYGYIAPEYAYTLQVDEKSDIYSYGVVLLEILSGKRSVHPEFGEGNSVVDWVRTKIKAKNGISDVLDKNAGASCASVREEMMLVLRVALLCTSRNPADRPSMRDVISMLQEAKPKRKSPSLGRGDSGDHVIEIGGCVDVHDNVGAPPLGEKK